MTPAERSMIERGVRDGLADLSATVRYNVVAEMGPSAAKTHYAQVKLGIERWVSVQAAAITALIVDEIEQTEARRAVDAMKQPAAVLP